MGRVPHADAGEGHYYPRDGSVFLDTHYLIKGVAGAIFWKLAREHALAGRHEFSARELRLAARELRLPEVQDNLSARLLLLQRRLAERGAALQIQRTGRGRFRVAVLRPMRLVHAGVAGGTGAAGAAGAAGSTPRASGEGMEPAQ